MRAWFRRVWCELMHENARRVILDTKTYGYEVRCKVCGREWWES